jgi:hypothetical protein
MHFYTSSFLFSINYLFYGDVGVKNIFSVFVCLSFFPEIANYQKRDEVLGLLEGEGLKDNKNFLFCQDKTQSSLIDEQGSITANHDHRLFF